MNLHAAVRQLVEGAAHGPFATQEIYNRAPYLAIGVQEFRVRRDSAGGLAA